MLLSDLIAEYIFNCKCRRFSIRTIKNYDCILQQLLAYLNHEFKVTALEELKTNHIKYFLREKDVKGRKPNYINDLLKVCKNFCKYLFEEQYTQSILTDHIKNVKKSKTIIKTFTDKQVINMLKCYSRFDYLSLRNKLMLILFFDTGIRLNELITLQKEQIKDEYIIIHGKGDKERVVPKSPFLSKWLFKYMTIRESFFNDRVISNYVFLSRNGKILTSEAIERIIKKAGEYAEIGSDIRVSPHTCRHTFAQMQLKNGLDVYSLSRIMGHENISITQQYLLGLKDKEVIIASTKTSPLMNLC
jgi:integrase/recombinase XerD